MTNEPNRDGMSVSTRLSINLQSVAEGLSAFLDALAGEPVPFVLLLSADGTAQYVSNLTRRDGVELIESLLARWKAGRADIPAHYNPDLKKSHDD